MKRPLLLLAVVATVGVCALCGAAAQAYASPPGDVAAVAVHSSPLTIPVGYRPTSFAPSTVARNGLVVVKVDGAVTIAQGDTTEPNSAGPHSDKANDPSSVDPTPSTSPDPAPSSSAPVSEPGNSDGGHSSGGSGKDSGKGNSGSGNSGDGNSGNKGNGNSGNGKGNSGSGKGNSGNGN